MKVLFDDAPDSVCSLIMSACPDVQIRAEEAGLVPHVISVGSAEQGIKPFDKGLGAPGLLDQASYILRHKGRIRPRVPFVKCVATPTATLHRGEVFFPTSVSMARADKAPYSCFGEIFIPQIFPVLRPL